ncbi:hypothetical protein BDQ17DRAFT_1548715 [Cyathus striatus]|nr:hypothetical protein BDQ17DRAFT_1548715 [Cyathus striatus]
MDSLQELIDSIDLNEDTSSRSLQDNTDEQFASSKDDVVIVNFEKVSDFPNVRYVPTVKYLPSLFYPPGTIICTSIPSQKDPNGVTECLIPTQLKSQILNIPGFPRAPPDSPVDTYSISSMESKGLGMVATRTIGIGQLIVAERPIILIPDVLPFDANYVYSALRHAIIDYLASRLPSENSVAMYWLANVHLNASPQCHGIFETNSMAVMFGTVKYLALTKEISRINHSCCPNALARFDYPSFSFHLRALRPIGAGEEITISYVDVDANDMAKRTILYDKYIIYPCQNSEFCCSLTSESHRLSLISKGLDLNRRYITFLADRLHIADYTTLFSIYEDAKRVIQDMIRLKLEASGGLAAVVVLACKYITILCSNLEWRMMVTANGESEVVEFLKWAEGIVRAHEGEMGEGYMEVLRGKKEFENVDM